MNTFSMKVFAKRRRSEERLTKLNECFLGFTKDPQENINRLTAALSGELMGGVCALYNKLDTGMRTLWRTGTRLPILKWADEPGHQQSDHQR